MYAAQGAESSFASYYFVVVILVFGFIVVNLYIAVIVQTFAIIRRKNDAKEATLAEMRLQQKALIAQDQQKEQQRNNMGSPGLNNGVIMASSQIEIEMLSVTAAPQTGGEQVLHLLRGLQLDQYYDGMMTLVDTPNEIWLLSQEDLASIGMKLVHIRRLMEGTQAPPAFLDPMLQVDAAVVSPVGGKTPAEEMFAFLRVHSLEQYQGKLIKLVDSLQELSKLSQSDFEYAGLKLHHARELKKELTDWLIAMPQEGEEVLNQTLIDILGGESVGMWRARIQRGSWFWQSSVGQGLLYIWYRQDPMVDMEDPPRPAPRSKFIDPYQWDSCAGRILSSTPWEVGLSTAIIINCITMSMNYHGATVEFRQMLGHFEVIFFCIFLGEMQLKFMGMGGLKYYFAEPFNQFDFVLVTTSVPSVISTLAGTTPFINLSMLRVMKMLRLLKLLSKTRQLILVVAKAAKPMGNLLLFIVFVLSLFAIFGMQMFAGRICDVKLASMEEMCPAESTPRTNMDDFAKALFALFQVMTGEDWNALMYNIMRDNPIAGIFFMCVFYILANYILMEMFSAVILENFQLDTHEKQALQLELLGVKRAKQKAAQELAAGVDKAMAALKEEERKANEAKDQQERERKIREQNEAKASGTLVENEAPSVKTPAEIELEKKKAADRDAALKQQMQEEMLANQKAVAMSDELDGYDEVQVGNSNKMILDAVAEGKKVKTKKDVVVEVVVEVTCFCFSKDNDFREFCYNTETNPHFDTAMFLVICFSSVVLALDSPYIQPPIIRDLVAIADPTILGIFTLEFLIRIISRGFSGNPNPNPNPNPYPNPNHLTWLLRNA